MSDYNPRHWNIPGRDYIPDITERHDYDNIEDEYIAMDEAYEAYLDEMYGDYEEA